MTKNKETFNKVAEKHSEKLNLFTTAITRAHGESHPEAFDVRELYENIVSKIKAAGASQLDVSEEFTELRRVTDNYTVPGDVCPTYEEVYQMLAELDQAYQSQTKEGGN